MDNQQELRHSAFHRMFEANQRAVFSYYIGHGVDREDAVDLVQDAFTKAWRQFEKVEGMDADRQRYWLFAVARNLLADFGRRRTVQAKSEQWLKKEAGRARFASPDRGGEVQKLIESIQSLPQEQRLILSLTVLGDMTSEGIGEQLNKPAGTIRYELHQTRAQLQKKMQDWRRES